MELILASASPRRKELLSRITSHFRVEVPSTSEVLPGRILPQQAVELLALQKAQEVFGRYNNCAVVGADTVVALEDEIFGKPRDEVQATQMLKALSGKSHTVYTGVAVLSPSVRDIFSVVTEVEFYPLTIEEISWYISTGEPLDKAGAYGIQGLGSLFVQSVQGDFFNVMGLPIARLWRVLSQNGILCKNKS